MLLPLRYSHITPPHNTLPTNASLHSIRGASDSVDSTHYLLTKEAEVEVGVAITSDSLKDHPAADATFFKIAKSESKLALYDEEAIEDEDPEDFEVEVESSNSNPSQEGEYDEYGDEDEMGLESFQEGVSGDEDPVCTNYQDDGFLFNDGIWLQIWFPHGTALEVIASSTNLGGKRLNCFRHKVFVDTDASCTTRPTIKFAAYDGIDNHEWIETSFHAVLPGQSDGCECGLRISYDWPKYTLAVSGCDCFHIYHYDDSSRRPKQGNVWPCLADGCRSSSNLRVSFRVEAN